MTSRKPVWSLVIVRKQVQRSAADVSKTSYARRLKLKQRIS